MASFIDSFGRAWTVELDGPLMGELRDQVKVDLADLSGAGYLKLETDVPTLVNSLKVLCRDQIKEVGITADQFARSIRKDTLTTSAEAVMNAAADFFPAKTWSEILSRCKSVRKMRADLAEMTPMLSVLDDPSIPERMKAAVMDAIAEMMKSSIASQQSENAESVSGQVETRSNSVSVLRESAEFDPAA